MFLGVILLLIPFIFHDEMSIFPKNKIENNLPRFTCDTRKGSSLEYIFVIILSINVIINIETFIINLAL